MRKETRRAMEKLMFMLSERGVSFNLFCACMRPLDSLLTPAIREAMDEVEKLMANEPDTGWYIEVD